MTAAVKPIIFYQQCLYRIGVHYVATIIDATYLVIIINVGLAARPSAYLNALPSVRPPAVSHTLGQTKSPTDGLLDIDYYYSSASVFFTVVGLCVCLSVTTITIKKIVDGFVPILWAGS